MSNHVYPAYQIREPIAIEKMHKKDEHFMEWDYKVILMAGTKECTKITTFYCCQTPIRGALRKIWQYSKKLMYNNWPIVEAIMDDRRPKTQEKGKDIASAREPISVTCSSGIIMSMGGLEPKRKERRHVQRPPSGLYIRVLVREVAYQKLLQKAEIGKHANHH